MALQLIIKSVESYKNKTTATLSKSDVTLTTDTQTAQLILTNVANQKQTYVLSLNNLSFRKKMYQPTEVVATILFSPYKTNLSKEAWNSIDKKDVLNLFKDKQVALSDVSTGDKIGEDFYVQEISPSFKSDSLIIVLKIYSLDKLLTLKHDCRAFVSQKLGAGILAKEIANYKKPYSTSETLDYNTDNMKVLSFMKSLSIQKPSSSWSKSDQPEYETKSVGTEHIFPFLVQYNESFYDLLARTANRWGEFLYYEDGQLNIGYKDATGETITHKDSKNDKFACITYINLDEVQLASSYERAAEYDKNILDNTLEKSPNALSGLLFAPGGKMDSVIMKKIAAFFKNDKNIPTFIGNQLFDDLYGLATKAIEVKKDNDDFDDEYFTDDIKKNWPEKYGDCDFDSGNKPGYNIFSEVKSEYSSKKYGSILKKEKSAAKNAVCIDFDTYFPRLKLGQVIEVYKKEYIVVQIDCKPNYQYKVNENNWVVANNEKPDLTFSVIATPRDSEEVTVLNITKDTVGKVTEEEVKETPFYPTVLASGHARYSNPQMATVTDAGDPAGKGRVRVLFSWQNDANNTYKKDISAKEKEIEDLEGQRPDAKTDTEKSDLNGKIKTAQDELDQLKNEYKEWLEQVSSPWLQYTANAGGGKGIMGKHYVDDKVFVGFVDGNVERPYVLGAVSKGAGSDIACETPGGHKMTIADNKGGISQFVLGTLTPGLGTLSDFIPGLNDKLNFGKNWDKNLSFAGGFDISDKYGIYKISGSTDQRSVSIASPWGTVGINAFTGITISAPNGDIKISGKNVSIEAGNNLSLVSGKNVNYKLWREKDSKKGEALTFLLDIPLAVAKKLTETLTNVVDLSIIRNIVEVVMRPVEGALTVKSNRFLKLEAGKNKCAYPVTAYKASKEEQEKKLDEEKKKDILDGTGKVLGVGKAMAEIFASIGPVVQTIDDRFQVHYNNCVDLKAKLKATLDALESWRNNQGDATKSALKKKFDDLYDQDLKGKLWVKKDKYEDLKEDDLQFSDEVKVDGDAKTAVDVSCHNAHTYGANLRHPIVSIKNVKKDSVESIDIAIVEERKRLRKKALDILNELGKEINYLMNFDMKRVYTSCLSSFYITPAPADYKDKMTAALSRKNCPNVPYYDSEKFKDALKKLDKRHNMKYWMTGDVRRTYTKRIVAMNLIKEFGFYLEDLAAADAATYTIDVTKIDANDKKSVVNNECWNKYVERVSGLPALGKAPSAISSLVKDAGKSFLNNLTFWDSTVEKFTWGNGADGTILFASDKKTFVLNSKGGDDADVAKASVKTLKESDFSDNKEKQAVHNFVEGIKTDLKNVD